MKKSVSFLLVCIIIYPFILTACKTTDENDNITVLSEILTDTQVSEKTTTKTDTQITVGPESVTFITEVFFSGKAEEVITKIEGLGYSELSFEPYALVVNSAENLSALSQLIWTKDVPEFNPQFYDEEFFKSGFILITVFIEGYIGAKYDIAVSSFDNESIFINKLQTYPTLSKMRDTALKTAIERHIAYNIIQVPYNSQSVYYIQTQTP